MPLCTRLLGVRKKAFEQTIQNIVIYVISDSSIYHLQIAEIRCFFQYPAGFLVSVLSKSGARNIPGK